MHRDGRRRGARPSPPTSSAGAGSSASWPPPETTSRQRSWPRWPASPAPRRCDLATPGLAADRPPGAAGLPRRALGLRGGRHLPRAHRHDLLCRGRRLPGGQPPVLVPQPRLRPDRHRPHRDQPPRGRGVAQPPPRHPAGPAHRPGGPGGGEVAGGRGLLRAAARSDADLLRCSWPPGATRTGHRSSPRISGLSCSSGCSAAVGTMASAVTPTAVAAGLGAFAVLVVAQLANNVPAFGGFSFQPHLESFARGAPGLEDTIYFLTGSLAPLVIATGLADRAAPGSEPPAGWAAPGGGAAGRGPGRHPGPQPGADPGHRPGRPHRLDNASRSPGNRRKCSATSSREPWSPPSPRKTRRRPATPRCYWPSSAGPTPTSDTRVLDFAKAQGEALRLGADDDGEVVVEIGERKEVVAPVIEQTVTSALQRLARGRPQTLCGLAGNGQRELDSEAPAGLQLARSGHRAQRRCHPAARPDRGQGDPGRLHDPGPGGADGGLAG